MRFFKTLVIAAALAFMPGVVAAAYEAPATIAGTTTVTPDEAKALHDRGVVFVDVRGDADWDAGRIPGAHHLALKDEFTEANLAKIGGKDAELVIYCNGMKCELSNEACTKAVAWGFTKIYYFRTGFPGWQNAGYPVE